MISEQFSATIQIPIDGVSLTAELNLPQNARGVVLFSNGSGSSRLSPRNSYVAQKLQEAHIGTLLFDLLTPSEDEVFETRFDINLLTERLIWVTRFLSQEPIVQGLGLGYFGANIGAATALRAASLLPDLVRAVVSRGGRPDLALPVLGSIKAPTLLIVGSKDTNIINMNQAAYDALPLIKQLVIVPGASHLFEEQGTLDTVAELTVAWFEHNL